MLADLLRRSSWAPRKSARSSAPAGSGNIAGSIVLPARLLRTKRPAWCATAWLWLTIPEIASASRKDDVTEVREGC